MNVQFGEYTCNILFSTYVEHDNISIQLVDVRDGQPVATATLNPDTKMESGYVCIKNYSENKGMLDVLLNAGIVSPPIIMYQTGFVKVPVCKLLVPVFEDVGEEESGA